MKDPKKQLNPYLRFTSMGLQMGVAIAVFVYGGIELDEYLDSDPLWTIVLSLTGVFAGLYLVFKEVQRINRDQE
ncbi:MAG: AtpZ/AtpI family protein [Flavobacteriia bacterium]|nr:AtpZ/AtpI family protein [Flavobacteriia bacterium]